LEKTTTGCAATVERTKASAAVAPPPPPPPVAALIAEPIARGPASVGDWEEEGGPAGTEERRSDSKGSAGSGATTQSKARSNPRAVQGMMSGGGRRGGGTLAAPLL